MPKIERLSKVVAKLRAMAAASVQDDNASVIVGFTARYALYIHENMEIWPPGMRLKGKPRPARRGRGRGRYWDPQGRAQPKFLEQPARQLQAEFVRIVTAAKQDGRTLSYGLLLAGLRLQREAQLRVPVDTGILKASAFTTLESGNDQ